MKKSNRTGRHYYRKKLERILGAAPDSDFLKLSWAMNAHQSGRKIQANRIVRLPDGLDDLRILPWTIETLLNEILNTPKSATISLRYRNCSDYRVFAEAYNALNALENAQTSLVLERVDVFEELRRLGQRQFEWQSGIASYPRLYRASYLYGGEITKAHFLSTYGLSIEQFSLICYALYACFQDHPGVPRTFDCSALGVTPELVEAAIIMTTISHHGARNEAKTRRLQGGEVAYQKSVFRKFPCIDFEGILQAPLPDLIIWRSTSGLFYDFVDGPDEVRNEISMRFETYCQGLIKEMLPALKVVSSKKYRNGRLKIDTPDILIFQGDQLTNIIECKATRMSHNDRYSISPLEIERRRYDEISKGIFQIWRMVSHVRRGLIKDIEQNLDLVGIVLTLDTWLVSSNKLTEKVISKAREIVAVKDPGILEVDCIPVIVCPIDYFETTLKKATVSSLLKCVKEAAEPKYDGWMLFNVHEDLFPLQKEDNPYPYKTSEKHALPWLKSFRPGHGNSEL